MIIDLPSNPGGSNDHQLLKTVEFDKIKVQNPFSENLNVFFPEDFEKKNKTAFRLMNIEGQIIWTKVLESVDTNLTFPVHSFPAGIYFLTIENSTHLQNFKILKFDSK